MDENNNIIPQEETAAEAAVFDAAPADGKKPLDTASLVLGIVAIVFALLFPLVTYPCGIVGLVLAAKRRHTKRTKAALIICIVALVVALANSIIGAVIGAKAVASLLG